MNRTNDVLRNKFYSRRGLLYLSVFLQFSSFISWADCIKTVVIMRHGEINFLAPHGQLDCQGLNRALALRAVLNTNYGEPAAIYAANPSVTSTDSSSDSTCYNYVRPLGTIEPTAVYFGQSVITNYAEGHVGGPASPSDVTVASAADVPTSWILSLPQSPSATGACGVGRSAGDMELARDILQTSSYCGQTIFVAWEHGNIPIIAYSFYQILGLDANNQIPLWPYGECLISYASLGYCTAGTWSPNYNFDTLYVVTINQTQPSISITLESEGLDNQSTVCPS